MRWAQAWHATDPSSAALGPSSGQIQNECRRQNYGRSDPAVPAQRMQVYQKLIFSNLESFIASGFPVLKGTLGEAMWQALIRDFLENNAEPGP